MVGQPHVVGGHAEGSQVLFLDEACRSNHIARGSGGLQDGQVQDSSNLFFGVTHKVHNSSRATAISQLGASNSTPMHGRPCFLAAMRVVPLPAKGSRMTPPVGVESSV